MVECMLNQEPTIVDSGLKTWGDLLNLLDDDCVSERQTVTAVRFDGVDQPTFRAPHLAILPLAPLRRIEVETIDRTRLLRGTLGSAHQSLPALAAGAATVARAFRGHDLTGAHEQFATLVEAIRTLTMLTVASATAAGADVESLACGVGTGAEVMGAVGVVLDTLAQAQEARDWVAVADTLEFDLAPALIEWGGLFDAVAERCAA